MRGEAVRQRTALGIPDRVHRLKRGANAETLRTAHHSKELANRRRPIVAFVGRSNVGKSSLLNSLLGTMAAKVSKTPGRTRTVYFYETAEGHDLADLPGTGFARVSRKQRAGWAGLVERLFRSGRVALAVHVIDPRVAEARADLAMREYLASRGVAALPVAAKWDRLSAGERAGARRRLEAVYGDVIAVSAKTGEGIENLRRAIRRHLGIARSPTRPLSPSDSRSVGVGEGGAGESRPLRKDEDTAHG